MFFRQRKKIMVWLIIFLCCEHFFCCYSKIFRAAKKVALETKHFIVHERNIFVVAANFWLTQQKKIAITTKRVILSRRKQIMVCLRIFLCCKFFVVATKFSRTANCIWYKTFWLCTKKIFLLSQQIFHWHCKEICCHNKTCFSVTEKTNHGLIKNFFSCCKIF